MRLSFLPFYPLQQKILLVALWVIPLIANSSNSLQPWQDPNYIQQAFNEIALKNEYRHTEGRILKWQMPIRYQFVYHNLKKNTLIEQLFHTHLQHLQAITNHPIQHYQPHLSGSANLLIHLTPDTNYQKIIQETTPNAPQGLARNSHCMAGFQRNAQNVITQAQVVIPVDYVFSKGLLVTCIVEETTQILGLPNDANWVNPSIANDASKVELLTGLDYLFLKILYDKSLPAGLPYPQNQKLIQRIIQKLNANGEIKHASQIINKMGLFPEIN